MSTFHLFIFEEVNEIELFTSIASAECNKCVGVDLQLGQRGTYCTPPQA